MGRPVRGHACVHSPPQTCAPPFGTTVTRTPRHPNAPLRISSEVADALADGRPIVALESTIIAHGFPRPRNLQLATDLEASLRSAGVTPATIAVLDGRACIGLDAPELERIANDD